MRAGVRGSLLLLLAMLTKPVAGATPAEVEAAIQKGIKYLYSTQVAGLWDPVNPAKAVKPIHWGGETALATYALLAAGESRQDPKLAKAIEFSTTVNMDGIYSLALRAQIWHYLPQSREVKAGIRKDGDSLLASLKSSGEARGGCLTIPCATRLRGTTTASASMASWGCGRWRSWDTKCPRRRGS